MSKKNITNAEAIAQNTASFVGNENLTVLDQTEGLLMWAAERYPNASLRKLAAATNLSYPVLLKRSKAPVAGQPYDPEATNWRAVAEYVVNHDVHLEDLDWEALNAPKQRAGTVGVGKSLSDYAVGQKVWLRRDNEVPYQIVYMTETHVVLLQDDSTEPIAWSATTFLLNGPALQPRTKKIKATVEDDLKETEEA